MYVNSRRPTDTCNWADAMENEETEENQSKWCKNDDYLLKMEIIFNKSHLLRAKS